MSFIGFTGFYKKHFLKDRRLSLCFKKWSYVLLSTPLHETILFFWTECFIYENWSSFVQIKQKEQELVPIFHYSYAR